MEKIALVTGSSRGIGRAVAAEAGRGRAAPSASIIGRAAGLRRGRWWNSSPAAGCRVMAVQADVA